ncbi:hypothetical protein B0T22DRAFT_33449 [Podospora appendiculata]|uniref:Glucose-methanol-choline oxidoreductase N-terminal domain-containing protein n=1 Tax=Podospora appendiculata TaxID=314037 RepID=A0AAE0XGL1_9PEZI|nr:hypothetical protein B0T22DRAFT_33449 [Podospora appendiculata]
MWPLTPAYPELCADDVDGKTYDYIIVGGGTAGCVLASRLSEDPSVSVLVLEKGRVKDNFLSRIPLLSQNFFFPFLQVVSSRFSEPISYIQNRAVRLWTAEGVGGATRINGMLLTRGIPGGYNQWAQDFGLTDWGWNEVEPYFRKSENAVGRLSAAHRGHAGPIENRLPAAVLGCVPYVVRAARAVGFPVHDDLNDPGASAQGIFRLDQTVDAGGRRLSAYRAWLNGRIANERKAHLAVCTGVVASRLVANGDGTRITGVRIRPVDAKGAAREYLVKALREVIVCSGTICTPQLLMLSGIGPRERLEPFGIPVVKAIPAVGANLSDHTSTAIMMELPAKHTFHCLDNPLVFLWQLFLYLFLGTGLLAIACTPHSIFFRTGAVDEKTMTIKAREDDGSDAMDASQPRNIPDIEIMINPVNCLMEAVPNGKSLLTWYSTLVQPHSRGHIELASTDPTANPRVIYPMLSDPRDIASMRLSTRFSMRLAEEFAKSGYPHPAPLTVAPGMDLDDLDSLYRTKKPNNSWGLWKQYSVPEKSPTVNVPAPVPVRVLPLEKTTTSAPKSDSQAKTVQSQTYKMNWQTVTDKEIDEYAKRVCVSSLHISCSCRMSVDPGAGVVDQKLRVHGFENLRIADASVFPRIPSAHTMAPTVMVAERCADFIKGAWAERKEK